MQNSLLNLPGMSDGSVTVAELETDRPVRTIDALQKAGLNPDCIILLPGQGPSADGGQNARRAGARRAGWYFSGLNIFVFAPASLEVV